MSRHYESADIESICTEWTSASRPCRTTSSCWPRPGSSTSSGGAPPASTQVHERCLEVFRSAAEVVIGQLPRYDAGLAAFTAPWQFDPSEHAGRATAT